jgi:hypothetical protein
MLPTTRRVRISRERPIVDPQAGRWSNIETVTFIVIAILSFGLAFLIAFFKGIRGNRVKSDTVTMDICQCPDCSKRKDIEPLRVDYDSGCMRLLVHRDFARSFAEANVAIDGARS